MPSLPNHVLMQMRLFPDEASTYADKVDSLYFFLLAVSGFFTVLIFLLILVFAVRYRRTPAHQPPNLLHGNLKLEILWIAIPFVLVMIMFAWGAKLYIHMQTPPAEASEIYVVGKQWMWKLQHPNGRREINELHIPAGRPIRLRMISEDVIHSFYVPAFRMKQDVLPGTYTTTWFEPVKPGEYHLFCAEYCGTEHSQMIGHVYVMEPQDYERWLAGGSQTAPMALEGEQLFRSRGCIGCHNPESGPRGPDLAGIFGRRVQFQDGGSAVADHAYLRESITKPNARIVAGYEPIMPSYEGQLTEEQILQIIEYIRSGSGSSPQTRPAATAPAATMPAGNER